MKLLILLAIVGLTACSSPRYKGDEVVSIEYLDSVVKAKDSIIATYVSKPATVDSRFQDSILKRNKYLQNAGDSLLRETLTFRSVCIRMQRYIDICVANPVQIKYLRGWGNDTFKPYLAKPKSK